MRQRHVFVVAASGHFRLSDPPAQRPGRPEAGGLAKVERE
jgi:hypothetical protein